MLRNKEHLSITLYPQILLLSGAWFIVTGIFLEKISILERLDTWQA